MRLKVKYPGVTNLTTTAVLTTAENKMSNVVGLVKKADYHAKISEI